MANVVRQKTANCIEWLLHIQSCTTRSHSFSLQNRKCHLKLLITDGNADLILTCDENLQLPLKVIVHVSRVGGSFSDIKIETITRSDAIIYRGNARALAIAEFKFEIILIHDVHTSQDDPEPVASYKDASFSLESLSHDFSKLLDEGPNHDVEFTCGDQIINAHKNILCSRSSVFTSMLQSDMVEGKTRKVDIKDMEPAIFQDFLRCLYTGTLPELTVESAFQFYEASDKYGVFAVKKQCRDFLTDNLSIENACDVLVLSDQHSDADFKNKVVEYLMKRETPYLERQRWIDFCKENSTLADEVLNRFYQKLHTK